LFVINSFSNRIKLFLNYVATVSQDKNRKSKFFALTQTKIDDETRIHHKKKESSTQTVIWVTNQRASSDEKNKSSINLRTAKKTTCWSKKSKSNSLLRSKVAQETTLFQRSTAFLIKSIFVLSFLDVQDNKLRSVVTILSEIMQLLWYLRYKAIASSIFYQKSNIDFYRLNLYHFRLT